MQIRKSKFLHLVVILKCSQIWKRKRVHHGSVNVWLVWCNCVQFFSGRSSLSISTLSEYRCGLIHLHCTAGYEHNISSHLGPTTGVAANPIMMGPGLEGTWCWLFLLPPRSDKARAAKIGPENVFIHAVIGSACLGTVWESLPGKENKTTPKPNNHKITNKAFRRNMQQGWDRWNRPWKEATYLTNSGVQGTGGTCWFEEKKEVQEFYCSKMLTFQWKVVTS